MSSSPESVAEFVLSFDFELGWGSIENGAWGRLETAGVFDGLRPALTRLLAEMDALDIPATFGMVGCLGDEPSRRSLDHVPAAMRETIERSVAAARSTTFDGRDLVDLIGRARAGHVFCSHSYTHMRFGHPLATAEFVERDLALFHERLPAGVAKTDAIIFPVNEEAFLAQVAAHFATCRGRSNPIAPQFRAKSTKLLELLTLPRPSVRSELVPGLWKETDSLLFNVGGRYWKMPFVAQRALRGLRSVVRRGETLHVYLHPFDVAHDRGLGVALRMYLGQVARLRDQGRLRVRTLGRLVT